VISCESGQVAFAGMSARADVCRADDEILLSQKTQTSRIVSINYLPSRSFAIDAEGDIGWGAGKEIAKSLEAVEVQPGAWITGDWADLALLIKAESRPDS